MTAAGIGSVSFAAIYTLVFYLTRSFLAMGNYADLDKISRLALDQMTRDIRQAQYLVSSASNQLAFNVGGSNTLTFTYDSAARQLTRSKTGEQDNERNGNRRGHLLAPDHAAEGQYRERADRQDCHPQRTRALRL